MLTLFEQDDYCASGHFYPTTTMGSGFPVQLAFQIERFEGGLFLEGTFECTGITAQQPLKLSITFQPCAHGRGSFALEAAAIGRIEGTVAVVAGTCMFAGRSESTKAYCGFSAQLIKPRTIGMWGVIASVDGTSIAFDVSAAPNEPENARENVVLFRGHGV